MVMKKLRFWTIALALLGQFATANDNVSVPINQVFERLNKERVTTGLLSDYGVQLIDIAYHLIRKKVWTKTISSA